MKTYTIILTSLTYVYKAQNILERNNIRAYVIKLPSTFDRRGCNYGLEVYANYLQNAVYIIESERIKIVEIQGN